MKEDAGWKMKQELARKYDVSAGAYDTLYSEEQEEKIESALESIRLRGSDVVLDVGCGTGLLFRHIEDHVGFLVGLDISRGLLERALHRSRDSSKISLVHADVDYLPFKNDAFDKVFVITTLQNVPNADTALHEVIRTAKENAHIIITGLKKSFTNEQLLRLLMKSGLTVLKIKTDKRSRELIAHCKKEGFDDI